jgi:hypothetical protein
MIFEERRKFSDIQLVDYMGQFFIKNHQLPPQAIIAAHFEVNPNAINERLLKLKIMGIIKLNSVGKYMFCAKHKIVKLI